MAMSSEKKGNVSAGMKLEGVFSMKGGKGEASYASNSKAQAQHARMMVHLLESALDAVVLPPPSDATLAIADLGCSSGQNSIATVEVIIKHLSKRYWASGLEPPEFHAFFSDLPSNDFNTLFHLLPPPPPAAADRDHHRHHEEEEEEKDFRSYYAAGVPGSFYRRLFPPTSVHVFHSAFSLHWLSQVPERVMDSSSPAYNRGRLFVHGASVETSNAYKEQFQRDMGVFLRARAVELKKGGSMFLAFLGRTSEDPADQGGPGLVFGTYIIAAFNDLIHQGLIGQAALDNFNMPLYAASLQDFKEVVEADDSYAINGLQIFNGGSPLVVARPEDAGEVGRAFVNSCRAVCGVLVEAHLGEQLAEELFDRLERRAVDNAAELMQHLQFSHIVASLSLK
ncbi:Indole-3-acetate O-methyltransferase 1 [Asimina triloba]